MCPVCIPATVAEKRRCHSIDATLELISYQVGTPALVPVSVLNVCDMTWALMPWSLRGHVDVPAGCDFSAFLVMTCPDQ